MSEEGPRKEGGFFNRWSRLKSDARESQAQAVAEAAAPAQPPVKAEDAPPELPPVDTLTIDSDFSGFLHPKVDEDLRRTALKKLFSDPHFNVMDGLDVYIDDYSVSEPIPAEMLAGLKQAQRILRWAEGHDDEEEAAPEVEASSTAPADEAAPAIESDSSDDIATEDAAVPEPLPQDIVKSA